MSAGFRRGSVLILLGTVGIGLAHWFMVWIIAQSMGSVALGRYSVVLAGASPIFVLANMALRNVYLTLRGAPNWQQFFLWRSTGMVVGSVCLVAYGALFAPYWGIVGSMALMKSADGMLDIVLARTQGAHRLSQLGFIMILNAALSIAGVAVVSLITDEVTPLLLTYAAVSAVCAILGLGWNRKIEPRRGRVTTKEAVAAAIPLTATLFLTAVLGALPVWYLEWRASAAEVGRYAALSYVLVFANLVGSSIQSSLLPSYRAIREDQGRAALVKLAARHLRRLLWVSLGGGVILVIFGDPLLKAVYGPFFGASHFELGVLAAACILAVLGFLWVSVLLVSNEYRTLTRVSLVMILVAFGPLVIGWVCRLEQSLSVAMASVAIGYACRFFLLMGVSRAVVNRVDV